PPWGVMRTSVDRSRAPVLLPTGPLDQRVQELAARAAVAAGAARPLHVGHRLRSLDDEALHGVIGHAAAEAEDHRASFIWGCFPCAVRVMVASDLGIPKRRSACQWAKMAAGASGGSLRKDWRGRLEDAEEGPRAQGAVLPQPAGDQLLERLGRVLDPHHREGLSARKEAAERHAAGAARLNQRE